MLYSFFKLVHLLCPQIEKSSKDGSLCLQPSLQPETMRACVFRSHSNYIAARASSQGILAWKEQELCRVFDFKVSQEGQEGSRLGGSRSSGHWRSSIMKQLRAFEAHFQLGASLGWAAEVWHERIFCIAVSLYFKWRQIDRWCKFF